LSLGCAREELPDLEANVPLPGAKCAGLFFDGGKRKAPGFAPGAFGCCGLKQFS
jgi:hypothetical protein